MQFNYENEEYDKDDKDGKDANDEYVIIDVDPTIYRSSRHKINSELELIRINIDVLKNFSEIKKYATYKNLSLILELIDLNNKGFYTIESQKQSESKNYIQRGYTIGFIQKDYFKHFKTYFSNREDLYVCIFNLGGNESYSYNYLNKEDSDLVMKKSENKDVLKIIKEFDKDRYVKELNYNYDYNCTREFYKKLTDDYIILFVSNLYHSSKININTLISFLIDSKIDYKIDSKIKK